MIKELKNKIQRRFHLGVYSQLAEIEELITKYVDVDFGYINGSVKVHHLKSEWQEALISFGLSEESLIFGINVNGHTLACISPGTGNIQDESYIDWLHKTTKNSNGWYYHWDETGENADNIKEAINDVYNLLQKFFMFMEIYIKQRNNMERLIKIEWDAIQSSLKYNKET